MENENLYIPKGLFTEPALKKIKSSGKILYSLLFNEAYQLTDDNPEAVVNDDRIVFLTRSIDEIMKQMRCSKYVANKLLNQLEEAGLIEKKIQGRGKPLIICVKNIFKLEK